MTDIDNDTQQATPERHEVVVAPKKKRPSSESLALIQMIGELAANPSVDVEKMKTIVGMKKDLFLQQESVAFNEAMARVQAAMKPVVKNADNKQTHSKYAKMEYLLEMITPIYSGEGFAISFDTDVCPIAENAAKGWFRIICHVTRGGCERERHIDLPPDIAGIQGNANKTPLHGYKSTLTYGKGMLMCMVFNIQLKDDTDDDGNGGGGSAARRKTRSVSEVYKPDDQQDQQQSRPAQKAQGPQEYVKPNQIKLLRTKMASAGKSEVDLLKRFEIKTIEELRFPQDLNGAMEWVQE